MTGFYTQEAGPCVIRSDAKEAVGGDRGDRGVQVCLFGAAEANMDAPTATDGIASWIGSLVAIKLVLFRVRNGNMRYPQTRSDTSIMRSGMDEKIHNTTRRLMSS